MHPFKRSPWKRWPALAAVLAVVFILYGIDLMSRSRRLQTRIAREVELLDELSRLNEAIVHLGIVHRVDLNTGQQAWPSELARVRNQAARLGRRFAGAPAIAELPAALEEVLHQSDSLHREVLSVRVRGDQRSALEAILQFMLQRAQKVVDRTARGVHEQGLGAHTASLSDRWSEAQVLLIAACLLAVVFAWLVGVSNRLLHESRLRAAQLENTRRHLEQTNRELRETMLSKEEKEVMLKEIHHRVKNNLQIVKSLIRFQMEQVKDPRTQELFNECMNRVSAMALVHEQSYLSKDLANIDVNNYLGHLVRDLCHAYTIGTRLHLDVRIDVPTLGVDTLIPLGLLINEVISNSLKYAFKGRGQGTIVVHLDGSPGSGLHLLIGDDGVGLADRSSWEKPQSLGMELIHTLAGQLDAGIELLDGPGTMYRLRSMQAQRRKRA